MRFSLFLFLLLLSSCGLYNGVTASEGEGEGEGEGETQPCNDADLDGYGEGCVLGDDCDESSRERFRQFDVFADSDGDGFTLGEPNSRCIGELAPEGFELIPSAEDDCDDSDESVFRLAQYFRDEDGDGFSDGDESIFFCRDGSTPEGFLSQASATIDCDDSDANVFEQADTFVDADGDGATSGNAIPECIGDTPPQGRRLTRSPVSDCDDSAADIFPSAPDVCNGVDDNCDGRTDFGVGSDCGVGCSPVYPDVDETLSLAENIDAGNMLSVFQSCAPALNFSDARARCRSFAGYDLLALETREEFDRLVDANFGGWAGLTDHGQGGLYRFIDVQEGDLDGPVLDYDVWLAGEPNNVVHNLPNGPEDEDCVLFVPAGFNDALCSFESPFFCEPLP